MTFLDPFQPITNSPGVTPFPLNGGSVLNSPMFQGYTGGTPAPSYLPNMVAPSIQAPANQALISQINGAGSYGSFNPALAGAEQSIGPATITGAETAAESAAPAARLGLRGMLGLLKTPEVIGPGAVGLLGSMIRDNTRQGTAPHVAGTALATGGGVGTLAGGASALGLLGGSTLGAPITIGAVAGGAGGSLINHMLGSGGGTDFGPFHWHNAGQAANSEFNSPDVDHVINIASDLFQQGDISKADFTTIVKQAQLNNKLGMDPKELATSVGQMVQQAAQLQIERQAQAKTDAVDSRTALAQQVAIAKLMQPELDQINQGAQGLSDSIAASRSHLPAELQPFADLVGRQSIQGAHRQAEAVRLSTLALPQIQALIASINQQNALQQAANYQAAKQASGTSGSSLSDLLNQAPAVAGAGGASGLGG